MTEPLCPDFKTPCKRHDCIAWVHVLGLDPQTGKEVDMWDCSKYNWDHKLLIQVAQKVNQVAACIESERNVIHSDMLTAIRTIGGGLLELSQQSHRGDALDARRPVQLLEEDSRADSARAERARLHHRNSLGEPGGGDGELDQGR